MQPPVPNFNPRPPRGGRRQTASLLDRGFLFQSTPSARRATAHLDPVCIAGAYFNPRPPRGGRQPPFSKYSHGPIISIHALREEGDASSSLDIFLSSLFQSTPSARRATAGITWEMLDEQISIHALREESDENWREYERRNLNFNPRPPRGERPWEPEAAIPCAQISIHALREESDTYHCTLLPIRQEFQSTPSARRATLQIPIFASLVLNFNPRPPRGGRLQQPAVDRNHQVFQSTPSARRATAPFQQADAELKQFQSTPSARRATSPKTTKTAAHLFQSTPSARRATGIWFRA